MNRTESPSPVPASCAGPEDPRVIEALRDYLAALEAGQRPSRREFVGRHPEIAQALATALDGLDFVHSAAPQLRQAVGGESGAAADLSPAVPLGDYQIVREVGRGGMGIVYEAVQLSLGRRVALKILPFAAALDPRHLQRFKNEAQAAAHLNHPHIVPVYGLGYDRGVHYYAMQYVEGFTLAQVIADLRADAAHQPVPARGAAESRGSPSESDAIAVSSAPLLLRTPVASADQAQATRAAAALTTERSARSPAFFRTVARLGRQAALALEHAHQVGVIHRDIKPGNLMVDGAGHLWVTDFGLARFAAGQGLTLTGDLVGTLRYASPEQVLARRGVVVDHRSDVYSLGVTLYELLTLQPAYPGDDRDEVLRQIAWGEPAAPRKLNPALPVELETILLKAMAREPELRYATAGDFADDLGCFLEDRPIEARRPSLAERLTRWARRHRTLVRAAAVGLVLAVLGLSAATAMVWRQKEQKEAALEAKEAALAEADKQRHRAEEKLNQALSGVNRLLWKLEDPSWKWDDPQLQRVCKELTEQGVRFFKQFIHEGATDPALRYESARAYQHLAGVYGVQRKTQDGFDCMYRAADLFEGLAQDHPEKPIYLEELGQTLYEIGIWHNSIGTTQKRPDQLPQAERAFERAFEALRRALAHDSDGRLHNRLAWMLTDCPMPGRRQPKVAVARAREAIAQNPDNGDYWNTLGIAYYRAGEDANALAALHKSMELRNGGNGFDWLFLAMLSWRAGDKEQAHRWYDRSMEWITKDVPMSEELVRYRWEAQNMLGIQQPAPPQDPSKKKSATTP